jgi:hypothetical protein
MFLSYKSDLGIVTTGSPALLPAFYKKNKIKFFYITH